MNDLRHSLDHPLRIVVADDDPAMGQFYQQFLPQLGHEVVAVVQSGKQLGELCRSTRFDLLITEGKLPDQDSFTSVETHPHHPVPVILVSTCHDQDLIERALRDHVFAYLGKPVKAVDLAVAILLATRRFAQLEAQHQETSAERQALAERKVVERAQGIVMRQAGVSEEEAYRRLCKLATDRHVKLIQAAQTVLAAEEAFGSPGLR